MQFIVTALKVCLIDKIFNSTGRAGRVEFWVFLIFAIALCIGFLPLLQFPYVIHVFNITLLILFIASFSAVTRRLHDTNRSALHLVPLVVSLVIMLIGAKMGILPVFHAGFGLLLAGLIYVLILALLPGTKGLNNFGEPRPLEDNNNNQPQ